MTMAIPLCVSEKSTSAQRVIEFGVARPVVAEVLTDGGSAGWRHTVQQTGAKSWRLWLSARKRAADADANANVEAVPACSDAEWLGALATASAFVAAAAGCDESVSRNEFVCFVGQQGFVSGSERWALGEAFDQALRGMKGADNAPAMVLETLRPLAGLSLASTVVRTAERVARADRRMRPDRTKALGALRSILFESADRRKVHRGGGVRSQRTALLELRGPRSPRPVP